MPQYKSSSATQTLWNIDGARFYELNNFMESCNGALVNYDLDLAYYMIMAIRRIVFAKYSDVERQEINKLFWQLQKLREQLYLGKNNCAAELYNRLDELYIMINIKNKEHGLYFRESDDPSRAVLKR